MTYGTTSPKEVALLSWGWYVDLRFLPFKLAQCYGDGWSNTTIVDMSKEYILCDDNCRYVPATDGARERLEETYSEYKNVLAKEVGKLL